MLTPLKASFSYRYYHLLWAALDLLFPPLCGGCQAPGSRWCPDCAARVQHPAEPVCQACGMPVGSEGSLCSDCRAARPRFHALRSWSVFEDPVRSALHRLKYRRDVGLGEALAPQLVACLESLHWPIDLVVPVPLGRKRRAERGYNQVNLIARPLAMAMGLAYATDALERSHETRSQVGLTRAQRQQNVRNAFSAGRRRVNGRVVLVVDDVATTGSTLASCAEALFAAGARDVFAFTVSRALPSHGLHAV